MKNPWTEISLSDYENHMSLDSVKQLQGMNQLMKEQLSEYSVSTAMVLGIAGGNGLEHVDARKYKKVYGVDINRDYLDAVKQRYQSFSGILECLCIDLINEADKLPEAELLIANLLIEYIGYECFRKVVQKVSPRHVSCVIQVNTDEKQWVSDSPYLHVFDRLDEVHHQMAENDLCTCLKDIGYNLTEKTETELPNEKKLVRLDFEYR